MTSRRKRKRQAQARGLTEAELRLLELLEEILEAMRWAQVLGYANQFLVRENLQVSAADRDRVLAAAAAAVERDGRIQDWRGRLETVRAAMQAMDRDLKGRSGGRAAAPAVGEATGAAGGEVGDGA
jgi:hypothetical protein